MVRDHITILRVPASIGDVRDHSRLMLLRRAGEGIIVSIVRPVSSRHVHEDKAVGRVADIARNILSKRVEALARTILIVPADKLPGSDKVGMGQADVLCDV